jgi:hypothetical protein
METAHKINLLLLLCILLISVLLFRFPQDDSKVLASWDELEELIHTEIRNFPHQPVRVRSRQVPVNDMLTRRIITVNIQPDFPQTRFHIQLASVLTPYEGYTYSMVSLPDKMATIHVLFNGTIVSTVVFVPAEG